MFFYGTMLQRIQTVYLLISALSAALLFLAPAFAGGGGEGTLIAGAGTYGPVYSVLVLFFCTAGLVCIFLYRKRSLQLTLCRLNTMVMMVLVFMFFFLGGGNEGSGPGEWTWGMALPLLSLITTMLAYRAIRRDEALVRAADRLR